MAFGTDTAAFKLLEAQRACDAKDAEIARLREDVTRLEAARLRPQTVEYALSALRSRVETLLYYGWPHEYATSAIADIDRCYPPEEY